MTTKLERIQRMEAELAALKKEVEEEARRWRGTGGDSYYCISSLGSVMISVEAGLRADAYRYSTGNYFKTEKQAEAYIQKLQATQRVKDRIAELNAKEGWVVDFSGEQLNCCMSYSHRTDRLDYSMWKVSQTVSVELLGSRTTIETVIEEMPEDCKLMLGVL